MAALIFCAFGLAIVTWIESNARGNDPLPKAIVLDAVDNSGLARKRQTIVFEPLEPRTVGDPEFMLSASASSGLPVSYSSSNPQVAIVEGNIVTIKGGGTAFLSASQPGDDMFHAAPIVIRMLSVNKLSQTIEFLAIPEEVDMGTAPFVLNATASSGLPVTFSSSDASVIRIDGNRCTILRAGTAMISCMQYGGSNYAPAVPVSYTITVKSDRRTPAPTEDVTVLSKPVGEWMFIGMDDFSDGEPVSVEIIDSRKNSVIRMTTKEQEQLSVNVAGMSPGIYYLELTQNERKITSRFVKR
jgi:hypothetical protein